MFYKKFNKKGFTLVELVVVIAIIAILAAVMIPMFINVQKRANLSADEQTVYEMNLALAMDEATNDVQTDVFAMRTHMEAEGYNFSISPFTNGYGYYWYQAVNRIVLINLSKYEIVYPSEYAGEIAQDELADDVASSYSAKYISLALAIEQTNPVQDDTVAVVGNGAYNDLNEAISNAAADKTPRITLLKDVESDQSIVLTSDVIFDLGGHTLSSSYTGSDALGAITIQNDSIDVTIQNGTIDLRGGEDLTGIFVRQSGLNVNIKDITITASANSKAGMWIQGAGTLSVDNFNLDSDNFTYGICAFSLTDITVSNSKIEVDTAAETVAIMVDGENGTSNLTMKNNEVSGYYDLYLNGTTKTTIESGMFTGDSINVSSSSSTIIIKEEVTFNCGIGGYYVIYYPEENDNVSIDINSDKYTYSYNDGYYLIQTKN